MNPQPERSEAVAGRRHRAEAPWGHLLEAEKPSRPELEASRLVHELKLHQIELEMQTEESS